MAFGTEGSAAGVHNKTYRAIVLFLLKSGSETVDAGVSAEKKERPWIFGDAVVPSQGRPRPVAPIAQLQYNKSCLTIISTDCCHGRREGLFLVLVLVLDLVLCFGGRRSVRSAISRPRTAKSFTCFLAEPF